MQASPQGRPGSPVSDCVFVFLLALLPWLWPSARLALLPMHWPPCLRASIDLQFLSRRLAVLCWPARPAAALRYFANSGATLPTRDATPRLRPPFLHRSSLGRGSTTIWCAGALQWWPVSVVDSAPHPGDSPNGGAACAWQGASLSMARLRPRTGEPALPSASDGRQAHPLLHLRCYLFCRALRMSLRLRLLFLPRLRSLFQSPCALVMLQGPRGPGRRSARRVRALSRLQGHPRASLAPAFVLHPPALVRLLLRPRLRPMLWPRP